MIGLLNVISLASSLPANQGSDESLAESMGNSYTFNTEANLNNDDSKSNAEMFPLNQDQLQYLENKLRWFLNNKKELTDEFGDEYLLMKRDQAVKRPFNPQTRWGKRSQAVRFNPQTR